MLGYHQLDSLHPLWEGTPKWTHTILIFTGWVLISNCIKQNTDYHYDHEILMLLHIMFYQQLCDLYSQAHLSNFNIISKQRNNTYILRTESVFQCHFHDDTDLIYMFCTIFGCTPREFKLCCYGIIKFNYCNCTGA